MDVLI